MKKHLVLAMSLWVAHSTQAQNILHVGTEAPVQIKSNTPVYLGGMVLEPSSDYNLPATSITKTPSASHYIVYNYATGTFQFSQPLTNYSGAIGFHYDESALNGIPEDKLGVVYYNENNWRVALNANRDAVNNYIISQTQTGITISELLLSDELVILPLVWGPISANRTSLGISVEWTTKQEASVDFFQVQKSNDGRNWINVGQVVKAKNNNSQQQYQLLDREDSNQRVYYRILQFDIDGRSTYSGIVTVSTGQTGIQLAIAPNPALNNFKLTGVTPESIQQVDLLDSRGAKVESWQNFSSSYSLQNIAAGVYQVRVLMINGETKTLPLIKK